MKVVIYFQDNIPNPTKAAQNTSDEKEHIIQMVKLTPAVYVSKYFIKIVKIKKKLYYKVI